VINVLPESQREKYRVSDANDPVPVSAILGFVILRQSQEAISFFACRRGRLRRKVAKQLNSIVNQTIAITVEHYERI
jgi:hypothetical protein